MLKKFLCFVFGHEYFVKQVFSGHARRVQCHCCNGDWAMNDNVRAFVPWDEGFTDLYENVMKIKVLK